VLEAFSKEDFMLFIAAISLELNPKSLRPEATDVMVGVGKGK
jgi:hypothetical protein